MDKKIDRRIIKTKKAIRNAYAELLKYKNSKDITIKDIADTADISRKTFYSYYEGIWQIEDEIENDIISLLTKELECLQIEEIIKNPYSIFQKLTEIINTDLDFYGNLISNSEHSNLLLKIAKILENKLFKSLQETIKSEPTSLFLITKFIIKGLTEVYGEWFKSDRKIPLEQLSKDVSNLIFNGLIGLANKQSNTK